MKLEITNWRLYYNDELIVRFDAPFWKLMITLIAMLTFATLLGIAEM